MEHLRLTEKNHSTQPEYYITDSHATDHIAHFVGNIKQLNILVGANNTRKSRFIRQIINLEQKIVFNSQLRLNEHLQLSDKLFDQMENLGKEEFLIELHVDDLPYAHQPNPIYQVVKTLLGLKSGYSLILRPETFERTIARLKSQLENAVETDDLDIIPDLFSALRLLIQFLCDIFQKHVPPSHSLDTMMPIPTAAKGIKYKFEYTKNPNEFTDTREVKLGFFNKLIDWIHPLTELKVNVYPDPDLIYIPTLRSSRILVGAEKGLYLETLKEQYWFRQHPKLVIETGLDLYEKIERARNGHRTERDNFVAFENFLSQTFFQERSLEIIPIKEDNNKRNIKISIGGDNDDVPIHDLGDGVQSIILLLLPIFTAPEAVGYLSTNQRTTCTPAFKISSSEQLRKIRPLRQRTSVFSSTHILTTFFPKVCSAHLTQKYSFFPGETSIRPTSGTYRATNTKQWKF